MMIWFSDKKIAELSDKNENIFQEAKELFDLRVEIYKKMILEAKNLKFEKSEIKKSKR